MELPVEMEELLEQFNLSSNSSSYCLEGADCAEADGVSVPSFVLLLTAIIYCLIFCAGITGNSLVIYCVLRFPSLHTVTNTYILNLALADGCFLLGVPLLVATMVLQGDKSRLCSMINPFRAWKPPLCHKDTAQGTQNPLLGAFPAFRWFFMA